MSSHGLRFHNRLTFLLPGCGWKHREQSNVNSSFSFLCLNFNVNQTKLAPPARAQNHQTWWFLGVPCPGPPIWHIVPQCVAYYWRSHREWNGTQNALQHALFVRFDSVEQEVHPWSQLLKRGLFTDAVILHDIQMCCTTWSSHVTIICYSIFTSCNFL